MNTDHHPKPGRGPLFQLRFATVAAIVAAVAALALTPASAAPAGASNAVDFDFVGETVQTYDVGQNVAWIEVEAAGAGGGYNAITPDMGKSEGALVTGTLAGDACDQLLISVAQGGTPAGGNPNGGSPSSGAGGWGGLGASGGDGPGDSSDHLRSAGGGGGATTVQCVSGGTTSTIAVAGGGGGDGGASGDDTPHGGGGSAGLGGSWTGGAGAHGSEILGGIGGGAAIESTGQGGTGGSGNDLGGHGGGGGGGVKGGGGGGGAGGTSTGGGGGAGSSVANLPLEDWGVTISGVNWNNSTGYPNGWVDLTVHMKPVPAMGIAIANTTVNEGGSIGSVSATLPTDATGTVDFADVTDPTTPVSLGSASVSEGGAVLAETSQPLQGVGAHTIQASYSGDGTYSTTSVTETVTVIPSPSTDARATTSVSATSHPATSGTSPVVEVSVSEIAPGRKALPAAHIPEGSVRVTSGGSELTRGDLIGGAAELVIDADALEPGVHTLEVDYLGSPAHRPSRTTVDVTIVAAEVGSSSSSTTTTTTTTGADATGSGSTVTSGGTLARTGVEGLPVLLAVGGTLLAAGALLLAGRTRTRRSSAS